MKRSGVFVWVMLLSCTLINAQQTEERVSMIEPYAITVSYDHTINLIFPYAVKSVDRGSSAVIVQKAKGVDNILQAKAAEKNFTETNLSVVTSDGKFYSFVVRYAEVPSWLNISFSGEQSMLLHGERSNEAALERTSWQVLGQPAFLHVRQKKDGMSMTLAGVYLSGAQLWLRLQLSNDSQIDFRPAYMRFFLRDKKRAKRTALREIELSPVYRRELPVVFGGREGTCVMGFEPFTIPSHQQLIIQLGDESGGRVLQLTVKHKQLLQARKLPD
jgi:conjugative transposon TraN protein